MEEDSTVKEVKEIINAAVSQIMNSEIRKVCFDQCFKSKNSRSPLNKNEKLCFARCMDKMLSAREVVREATSKILKDLNEDKS